MCVCMYTYITYFMHTHSDTIVMLYAFPLATITNDTNRWLKRQKFTSLMLQGVRSPKWRFWDLGRLVPSFLRLRGPLCSMPLSQLLVGFMYCWLMAVSLQSQPPSSPGLLPHVSISKPLLYKDVSHWVLGPPQSRMTPSSRDCICNNLIPV